MGRLAMAGLKDFERRSVRRVFEHQGADHANAGVECLDGRRHSQGLGSQGAVQVAPRQSHQFDVIGR